MCQHCSRFATERFFSDEDFAAFEKALGKKLVDGTFVRLVNPNQIAQNAGETTFQCSYCGTDWVLSVPEGDWQGYFLPENQLAEYEEYEQPNPQNQSTFQTTIKGGQKGCGFCLALFFVVLALIIYIIYSVFDFVWDIIASIF
jgi:hypothetical protein